MRIRAAPIFPISDPYIPIFKRTYTRTANGTWVTFACASSSQKIRAPAKKSFFTRPTDVSVDLQFLCPDRVSVISGAGNLLGPGLPLLDKLRCRRVEIHDNPGVLHPAPGAENQGLPSL